MIVTVLRCERCHVLYFGYDAKSRGDRCLIIRGVDAHICDGMVIPFAQWSAEAIQP